jgi:predicted CopG family antitoxin
MINVQQREKESTIVIKNDIRERLKKIGYKGQTYNEIISKLLDLKGNGTSQLERRVLKSNEASASTLEKTDDINEQ